MVPHWRGQLTELAAGGQEIGLHSHTHRFLAELGPVQFAGSPRRRGEPAFSRREGQSWSFSKLLFARRELMLDRTLELAGPESVSLSTLAIYETFLDSLSTLELPYSDQQS